MGCVYQVLVLKMLLILYKSLEVLAGYLLYQCLSVHRHPGEDQGLPLAVPWNACTDGVRKCVYETLTPGVQLACWKAVKSGFGSFHLGYEVQRLHGTESEQTSWNCC